MRTSASIPAARIRTLSATALAALGGLLAGSASAAEHALRFDRDIRPLLAENCYACHGPGTQEAGLRLDSTADATRELDSGSRAIVPGDPAASEALARIASTDPDTVMPPPHARKTLTAAQRDLLTRWIKEGAKYERHWSFTPLGRPEVPDGSAPNPIDRFVEERLADEGLVANPEADRPTLIRRLSFALVGLPPTPAEVAAFVADTAPDAYERLVDRLLASPHHGEEMARHWLDNARYADTHGLHLDNERQIWAYRDWVVQACNDNMPFDRFTIAQIAGDMLPAATDADRIATGFCRCNVTSNEGGSIDEELRFRYAVDRTATLCNAWLGLTGQCAVCHDHKFDPLPAKDFYSLYAFFNSAADEGFDGNVLATAPALPLRTVDQRRQLADLEARLRPLEAALDTALAEVAYVDPATQPAGSGRRETLWVDDDFPAGATPFGGPDGETTWLTGGAAFSGSRCLDRTAAGLGEDYYVGAAEPFVLPEKAELFAHVWLDPAAPPTAVMLQVRTAAWAHRAVWGDRGTIAVQEIRKLDAPGVFQVGDLPAAGGWVRIAVGASNLGLKAGDRITGLAFTQAGGHVRWDAAGVAVPDDAAKHPRKSLLAWWKSRISKHDDERRQRLDDLPAEIRDVAGDGPDKATDPVAIAALRRYWLAHFWEAAPPRVVAASRAAESVRKLRDDLQATLPRSLVFADLPQMRESFVMQRGAYDKPGAKVTPATPAFLPPMKLAGRTPTRLDLARWLVAEDQPLTPRVAANRLWQQFFGTGIVKTSEDFGLQGEPPSHPELLDWLARTYVDSGWDTKALVRRLVTSRAFRRAAHVRPELLARDPENRLLARGPRLRLDAEQIRDNALAVSGLLVPTIGGRGVRPYQPDNIWEPVGYFESNTRFYKRDTAAGLYRRSLYTFLKRTAPPPFMSNFDAPSREQFCARRERSNTPLQALQLMNDTQHVEAARALAARTLAEAGGDDQARVAWMVRTVLAREAEPTEIDLLARALADHRLRYAADAAAAAKLLAVGESRPPTHLPAPELAAWTLVANTVLNLDETLTRN
jgi:hypothetical protein